jgi:long-chain acyl-CoA synthetase
MTNKNADTIFASFKNTALKNPKKPAFVYIGTPLTYGNLLSMVERFAASLYALGIRKGHRMMLYLPNTPQWVIAWMALQRLGGVPIPIAPIYTAYDLRYMAGDSGAESIVCADVNFGYVKQALETTGIKRIIPTNLVDLLPVWKRFMGWALDRVPRGKIERSDIVFPFKELLKKGTSPAPDIEIDPGDMAEMLYTGGTTKHPKGVPISHALFLKSAVQQRKTGEPLIPLGEDVVIQGGPLFHILGQMVGLGPLCVSGDTIILLPRVNLDAMMDAIQRFHAKTLFGVPALYRMILEHDRLDFYDQSSLIYCFSGGDLMPEEVARRWETRFGIPIYQGYGATETCGGVSLSPVTDKNPPRTIGKVLPIKEIKIVNPDTVKPVSQGTPGELLVHSDPMVTAYWNKPEETAESFVTLEGKLWYRTGDVISQDENGYLYFVDRTVDVIKHKGYRVSASEVEAVLQEHPAVIGTCVVGVPDKKVGERIKAFVVLKEDVKGVTGYELTRWCREQLASYKVPQYIEFRDSLPKSKVGKLLRREMRSQERKKIEQK